MPKDNDRAVFGEGISTSSNKSKHHSDEQYCRLIPFTIQFPEELVYEVFLRLPVKSLYQFRCVSKGICAMIDSSIFVKNHNIIHRSVIISERDREYAIFLYQPRLHRLFSLSFVKDDDNNNNLNRGKAIELNFTFLKEEQVMIPMGWCSNGIFGFKSCRRGQTSYVLWNPSNGTFRKVDCSSSRRPTSSSYSSMGYDYVNDDYKIIRFIDLEIESYETSLDFESSETSLEVYSFRKDSWRKSHGDIPEGRFGTIYGVLHGFIRAVCLGGVMHWLWTNSTDKSVFIAAFDLATETFTSLPLPLEPRKLQLQPCRFTDFRGRLCLTFLPPSYPSSGARTIWVMEKYGVESSWSKLYGLDRALLFPPNFYFPNSRRRLLCNFRWLSWWDPQDSSFEDIEIPGLLNDQAMFPELYYYEAYVYVRNLVRLDQSWEPPR